MKLGEFREKTGRFPNDYDIVFTAGVDGKVEQVLEYDTLIHLLADNGLIIKLKKIEQ